MCTPLGLVGEVGGLNTLYQGKKNIDEMFGWNQKKETPSSTTNIYNYGSSDTTKTPNRASLNTKDSPKGNSKGGAY